MHVFRTTPSIELGRVLAGAAELATRARPPHSNGNSCHVLLLLTRAFPAAAAAVRQTGVDLEELQRAADAGPAERDYDFVSEGPGAVGVPEFVTAVLRDPATEAGRLAAAWGWSRRDVEAVAAAVDAVVPIPLPGWTLAQ